MSNIKKGSLMIIPALLIIIFTCISTIIQGMNMLYALKFILFEYGCILLPGIIWLSMCRRETWGYIEFVVYAFVLGFVQAYPIYFITVPFSKGELIPYAYLAWLVLSCIVCLCLNKKRRITLNIKVDKKDIIIVCGMMGILMLVNVVTMGAANFLPDNIYSVNSYYQDHLYFCGNIAELAKEFPPVNFRAIFQEYSYHYFYSMQLAVVELFTQIPAFELGTFYSYIQVDFILAFAVLLVFDKVVGKLPVIGKIIGVIALFFSTGLEETSAMTYVETIFFVPNGMDLAYAMGFVMISSILIQYENDKFEWLDLIVAVVAFFVCIGSKGPVGIVYGGTAGLILLTHFIKTHEYKTFFLYIIAFLCVAIPMIFIIYLDNIISNLSVAAGDTAEGVRTIYSYEKMQPIVNWVTSNVGISILNEIILLVIYVFLSNVPVMLLLLLCIEAAISKVVKFEVLDYVFFVILFMSIIVTRIVAHPGLSQTYFLQAAIPLAVLIILRVFLKIYELLKNKKRQCNYFVVIISFVILFGVVNLFIGGFEVFINNSLNRGVKYLMKDSEIDYESAWVVNSLTNVELDAYRWLRDNVDEKERFICDTNISGYGPYAYCPGVFSERHMYVPLEERDLCEKLMQGSKQAWSEVKEMDIDYMILTKRISKEKVLPARYGKKIFENEGVRVYRLTG